MIPIRRRTRCGAAAPSPRRCSRGGRLWRGAAARRPPSSLRRPRGPERPCRRLTSAAAPLRSSRRSCPASMTASSRRCPRRSFRAASCPRSNDIPRGGTVCPMSARRRCGRPLWRRRRSRRRCGMRRGSMLSCRRATSTPATGARATASARRPARPRASASGRIRGLPMPRRVRRRSGRDIVRRSRCPAAADVP